MVEQEAIEIPDFRIEEEETGTIYAKLFDHFATNTLSNVDYIIRGQGGSEIRGTTDSDGIIGPHDVQLDNYIVTLEHPVTGRQFNFGVPWLITDGNPHYHSVAGYYYFEVNG
ncbi:MAG: hypothetical protein KAW56_07790 [Candidatus Marinimicrobia bacterium]|nr:hypothetical protein [Candidatus Neomarinimicrobiota bacterium]